MRRGVGTFFLLILGACSFREDKLADSERARVEGLRPWFTNLSINLLQPKCFECHNGAGSRGRVDLSTYESILQVVVKGKPLESPLYLSLKGVGGNMPLNAPALSTRELKTIFDWITAQAPKDGSEEPPPPPPPPQSTFVWLRENIIEPKCIECHSGPGGDGGVNLSTYESFANDRSILIKGDPENSLLYDVVKTDFMPYKNSRSKLTPEEKQAVFDWIAKGALKEETEGGQP